MRWRGSSCCYALKSEPVEFRRRKQMSDRLLTDAEIEELTGYQQPAKQVEFLRDRLRLIPAVRPDGRPRITFAAVTAAMIGALPDRRPQNAQPDFSALRRRV